MYCSNILESEGGCVRIVVAFLVALVVAYAVGALTYSQINLAALVEMGMPVTASVRIETALHDLVSMGSMYLPIVAVALLVGFGLAAIALRWLPQVHTLGYIVAGFLAMYGVDAALQAPFGTHLLAVTRSSVGLLSQCIAGAVGGYVFSLMLGKYYTSTS